MKGFLEPPVLWIIVGGFVLVVMLAMAKIASLYRKVGPHEALLVYGFREMKVVKAGGKIIWPVVENFRVLSLELMSFDVAPQQNLYTKQGAAASVKSAAPIHVRSAPPST